MQKTSSKNSNTNSKIKLGVIGFPIQHSLSPAMHNAAIAELKLDFDYSAYEVKLQDLKTFLQKLKNGEIKGINVTIPHKQEVIKYLDQVDPLAKKINAVNTIVEKNGKLIGYNTDGRGYLKSLFAETNLNKDNIQNIIINGCGGASLAIIHTLADLKPKKILIVNRTLEKANQLKQEIKRQYPHTTFECTTLEKLESIPQLNTFQIFINTTPLGMKNYPWPNLNFLRKLAKSCIISDIVYNPKETELLKKAKELHLNIHYGLGMLLYQGALAFELFTGLQPNISIMKNTLENNLSN